MPVLHNLSPGLWGREAQAWFRCLGRATSPQTLELQRKEGIGGRGPSAGLPGQEMEG